MANTSGRFFFHAGALVLLLLMALLSGGAARRESVTFDEVAHAGAGVSYLQKLDLRMNLEHPPLAKVIAAVPLVLRGAHADYNHVSWTFSKGLFYQYLGEWVWGHWFLMQWNDPHSTLLWARAPMLLMTLLLGVTIYLLGTRLGGSWAGLLCLAAFATTPAFLAFGPLVITDIPVTLFWILTVLQLPKLWQSPSRGTVVRFGLALAGALLSKFSSGLLFFVFIAFALSLRFRPLPEQPVEKIEAKRWRRRAWCNVAKGTLWAAFFVYVFYLIFSWNQPTDSLAVIPHFLRRPLMPLWLYLQGLAGFALTAGSRPTFILGHFYSHGVWFYFPVLFALKSQVAFLILLLFSAITALFVNRRPRAIVPEMQMPWRSLWISLVLFVAVCMLNRLDISIRHFLIALALLCLMLAPLPRLLESKSHLALAGKWLTAALVLASIITAIRAYPYYIPYVNFLAMGQPAYAVVNDSNVDWNQSLPEVEKFVQSRRLNRVLLDEYGFSSPVQYVPQASAWNCQTAEPPGGGQWAVISANYIVESRNCEWLLRYPHQPLGGGSMYAFELPKIIPAKGEPGGPPLPADYHYLAGNKDLDPIAIFGNCVRDPTQLQPTLDRFAAMYAEQSKKK